MSEFRKFCGAFFVSSGLLASYSNHVAEIPRDVVFHFAVILAALFVFAFGDRS